MDVWQPRSILVTGGCGFIGSNFINYMFDKWPNTIFVVIDRLDDEGSEYNIQESIRNSPRYKLIKECLTRKQIITKTLFAFQVDTVVHFAAITHVDQSYSDRFGTIIGNVAATVNLLEAVTFEYKGVKRFVHISTDEVYGDSYLDATPKTEQSLLNPTNPYAASKGACELIIKSYWRSYKLPFLMVRMNNVYGPRQASSKLIPKFTLLAIEEKPYPLMGDGQHTRNWMFVDDCAEAIKRVTETGRIGETYNIGTEFETTNYSVTEKIHNIVQKKMHRPKSKLLLEKIPDRPYHDRRYYMDCSKIKNEMKWSCKVPFEEGLQKTIDYYIDQYQTQLDLRSHG
uniref:dTDP-D-glucose 4,6-dehydratase n=1 Tax=Syphacia muris TaxID=451379 RepID=A0A0N5B1F9_9BILA